MMALSQLYNIYTAIAKTHMCIKNEPQKFTGSKYFVYVFISDAKITNNYEKVLC